MRVFLLRHARVLVEWKKRYTSAGYDAESARYDAAPIETKGIPGLGPSKVYVSRLPRTAATAELIEGKPAYEVCGLLDEVPIRSFRDSQIELPTWLWNLGASFQWLWGSGRQREGRRGTRQRARSFLDLLEARGEDCVVVGHGIFFYVLMKEMKARGYSGEIKRYMRNAEVREFALDQGRESGGKR